VDKDTVLEAWDANSLSRLHTPIRYLRQGLKEKAALNMPQLGKTIWPFRRYDAPLRLILIAIVLLWWWMI
jgi:hypothetical protein